MFKKNKESSKLNPSIYLNFGNNNTKELEINIEVPHKGEQFQYNGILYDITNVKYHYKEGFDPYIELFLGEVIF